MSKILLSVLVAAGVLAGCSTDTGLTYTANKVNIAGQRDAYRVSCSGLFESQKACVAEAVRICKDQQVVPVQAIDGLQGTQGTSDARELTFSCGLPPVAPPPQAPVPAPVVAPVAAPARRVVLQGDTNFDTGSSRLTSGAQAQLDTFLAANSGVRFSSTAVSGYTDSTGSVSLNQSLSQSRAESVAAYLKAHGLQSDRIVVRGFGSAAPVATNSTAVGRSQNRRVEINVTVNQ